MQSFNDDGQLLDDFASTIDVLCPECGQPATMIRTGAGSPLPGFSCFACGFTVSSKTTAWFRPWQARFKGRCEACGENYQREAARNRGTIPQTQVFRCECCGATGTAKLSSWQGERGICEPCYGIELRWQMPVGSEILWAYNREHLEFLEAYIGADLRQREPNRNASLASRLPKWIKNAKNREDLRKTIRQLLAKANS